MSAGQRGKIGIRNDEGKVVDLYIPRKCSATNKIIGPKDFASVQLNILDVDENGVALNTTTTFAISGRVRATGTSDASLNRLLHEKGFLSFSK